MVYGEAESICQPFGVIPLEYGTDTVEIQADAIAPGQRVVVLDDLLATGGTMKASIQLLRQVGAAVRGAACIIELAFLDGGGVFLPPTGRTVPGYRRYMD